MILLCALLITKLGIAQTDTLNKNSSKINDLSIRIGSGYQLTHLQGINYSGAIIYSKKYFSSIIGYEYFGSNLKKFNTINYSGYLLTTNAFFISLGSKVKIKKFNTYFFGGGFIGFGWNKYTLQQSHLPLYMTSDVLYRKSNKTGYMLETNVNYNLNKKLQIGCILSYFKYKDGMHCYDVYNKYNLGFQFSFSYRLL